MQSDCDSRRYLSSRLGIRYSRANVAFVVVTLFSVHLLSNRCELSPKSRKNVARYARDLCYLCAGSLQTPRRRHKSIFVFVRFLTYRRPSATVCDGFLLPLFFCFCVFWWFSKYRRHSATVCDGFQIDGVSCSRASIGLSPKLHSFVDFRRDPGPLAQVACFSYSKSYLLDVFRLPTAGGPDSLIFVISTSRPRS